MIDYDKCLSLQERAVEQLKTSPANDDVKLTVELCGIVVRMLYGFEKTLGFPADDLPALQAASKALGCGGKGCGTDEMQACLQCCRKMLQIYAANHGTHCDNVQERLRQRGEEALQRVAAMRALLQEWTDMPAEPSAGDGLCITPEVAAEHKEWANRYSDLVMRTTTTLRSPL